MSLLKLLLTISITISPASAGVSRHSGFVSLASPETYLEACAAADVQWFKTNYPNFIEPHSVNQATPMGESCAHLSAFNDDQKAAEEVLRRYLNSGGRFSSAGRNKAGANPTALAVNVLRGNVGAVKMLIEHNADLTTLFRNGNNGNEDSQVNAFDVAIDAAAGQGEGSPHMRIARMLEEAGAKSTKGKSLSRAPPPPAPPAPTTPVKEELAQIKEEIEEVPQSNNIKEEI